MIQSPPWSAGTDDPRRFKKATIRPRCGRRLQLMVHDGSYTNDSGPRSSYSYSYGDDYGEQA